MSVAETSANIVLEPLRHVSGLGANLQMLTTQQRETLTVFRSQVELTDEARTLADYLTDAVLVRFLIARDWDCEKALKMATGALQWRLKRMCHTWSLARDSIDSAAPSDSLEHGGNKAREVALSENATTGKIRVAPKPDKHGRPVMVLDNSRENCNDANAMIEYLAFNMELCSRTAFVHRPSGKPLADKIMLVLHMSDFSIFNQPPMAVTKETITILGTAFPESLGTAVILNPPIYFTSFWSLLSPLIDPKTRDKVYMLRGSMANGSPNDGIMCELIGDNWKELTGCDLGILSQGFSSKHRKLIDASPGFEHSSYWPTVLDRETAYRGAQRSGAVLAAATLAPVVPASDPIVPANGSAMPLQGAQDSNSDSPTSTAAVDGETDAPLSKSTLTTAVPQQSTTPQPSVKGWRRMRRALSFSSNSRSNRRVTLDASPVTSSSSSSAAKNSARGPNDETGEPIATQASAPACSVKEKSATSPSIVKLTPGADSNLDNGASSGGQVMTATGGSSLIQHSNYDDGHRIALDALAVVLCVTTFCWLLDSCPQLWVAARIMGSAPAQAWVMATTGLVTWREEGSGSITAAATGVYTHDTPSMIRVAGAVGELAAVLTAMLALSHAATAFASAETNCGHSPQGSLNTGSANKPQRLYVFLRGCRRGIVVLLQVTLLATFFALTTASLGAPKEDGDTSCGPHGRHGEGSTCENGAGSASSNWFNLINSTGARSSDNDPEVQYMEVAVSLARLWAPRFVVTNAAVQLFSIIK